MAVPKRKTSKSKGGKRRTHYTATVPSVVLCPHCKEPKLPHVVCPKCGMYKGSKYLEVGEA